LIGGINANNPVNIQQNKDRIRQALLGGNTPLDRMNQQFVATQLSFAIYGGTISPAGFATFWSPLHCSGLNFQPVTLSNGTIIGPDTLVTTLFEEATSAIKQSRTEDMILLTPILALLNEQCGG